MAVSSRLVERGALALEDADEYARQLRASQAELDMEDRQGTHWRPMLVRRIAALSASDRRVDVHHRLPRSALFGALVVEAVEAVSFPRADSRVRTAGRLVNVFVTSFDAVCDVFSEHLPATVAAVRPTLTQFPAAPDPLDDGAHPVPLLVADVTGTLASSLGPLSAALPEVGFAGAVREAYEAQLASLRRLGPATPDVRDKSAATFAVALRIPALVHGTPLEFDVDVVADALGDLFGWVDDLTDLRVDALTGQPNGALRLLGDQVGEAIDDAHLRRLEDETTGRWHRLLSQLSHAGLDDDRVRHRLSLSLMSWLG